MGEIIQQKGHLTGTLTASQSLHPSVTQKRWLSCHTHESTTMLVITTVSN